MDDREVWSLRIKEAHDREALRRLDDAVRTLGVPWVGRCRIEIGARLARMRADTGAATPDAFAARYGLPAPTGHWLYGYRLGAEAFARLERDLAGRPLASLAAGHGPGLFVLWASEWFRRCYRGGGHRWADLCAALGVAEDQQLLRSLTRSGLKQWRRPVIASGGASEYLGSLAREGGFPAAAVEDGGKGWAQDVLRAVVAPLLAEPAAGEERARELAAAQKAKLPQLFRDDDFVALCADLALAIVALRREADAPATAAGLPVIAWLALHRPGWRDRLPLSTGERAADALVEGLMKVEAVGGAAAGVERLLEKTAGGWREAVRLTLDGALDAAATRGLDPGCGRLRVFAAGEMARAIPGELALLEPPGEGDTAWEARSTKRARGIQPLPFAAAVVLDLRQGEQRVGQIAIAGGKPRRGALLVTVAEDDADAPAVLRVVGSGSGHYRADPVIVQAPADWRFHATAGETVTAIGPGMPGALLWRVGGGAFVTDASGDRHRILCGQPQDQPSRIELVGDPVRWAEAAGDVDLYQGPPFARVGTGGSLCRRAIGAREWSAAANPLPVGHYELGWRRDGILLDRRRIAVLPRNATLTCSGRGREVRYALAGWSGATLTPAADAPVRDAGETWQGKPTIAAAYWFNAEVRWPGAPPLAVRITFPGEAAIARWSGEVLRPNTRITLAELRDLVAVDNGAMRLFGELIDPGRPDRAAMTWAFENELPMSSVAADIASLLMPCSSIDASVKLGMLDGIETYWHVQRFAIRMEQMAQGLVASEGIVTPDTMVCGRCFADPAVEHNFGAYSLLTEANHRPFILPDACSGDWLIYLRSGDTVLSRPEMLSASAAPEGATPLRRAMALPPWNGLDAALDHVLGATVHDAENGAQTVGELVALAASLEGLPPATFAALRILPRQPTALSQMAFAASAGQRDAVMALSDALPFAWCLLPKGCWDLAFRRALAALTAELAAVPGGEGFAMQALADTIRALVKREPLLEPVLMPGLAPPRRTVTQLFLHRAVDRVPLDRRGSRYRDRQLTLPTDHLLLPDHMLEVLDAPYAAALAAMDQWTPGAADIRHIKTVARNFPSFFADAFAASLQELS